MPHAVVAPGAFGVNVPNELDPDQLGLLIETLEEMTNLRADSNTFDRARGLIDHIRSQIAQATQAVRPRLAWPRYRRDIAASVEELWRLLH